MRAASLILIALTLTAGCGSQPAAQDVSGGVKAVWDSQVAAWNRGDLEGFMEGYWKSSDLVFFASGTETRGWQQTLDRYRAAYQGDGKQMGTLDFPQFDLVVLGPESAMVRGRWRLKTGGGTESTGMTSVIFRKLPEGWRIVHDHSSSGPMTVAQQAARDPLVKENGTVKVGEHTYVIPDDSVQMVPNVGIIVGSRATLVIDPGLGRRNGEAVLREVAKVSRNTELYIASTHYHVEHTTGYLAFPASAKYVSSTVQEADAAAGSADQIRTFASRSAMTADLLKDATLRKADITFDREHVLDLGGVRVRFVVVGPTHTRGDTGLFVESDGVLFSGDVVMNRSFLAANPASSITAWLAAFDTFDRMRPRTIVPSHGPMGDGSSIAIHRDIMRTVQARVRELKARGQTADQAASTLQTELQSAHPDWPRANGVAGAARAAFAEAP